MTSSNEQRREPEGSRSSMNVEWKDVAMYLAPIAVALAAGKSLKRLVLLPFEYLARKTDSPVIDKLVEQAEEDLGIQSPTLPPEEKKDK